ncbi:tRNA1(Val) (adenine(37)-N6)-methyltransferase [Anaerovorax odorimutans]|uniref:tRNA1(Val) (adenine(37)-N6)-methyltransferase n=1 Tax=Anaerovorax odorimutans TaxID=109327 RepID=UPI0004060684|nr:tRNA1(Val) (adenine(37)-N6)-methyltransferase [Anaerovorax odorimutans]
MNNIIYENERIDEIGFKNLKLIQNPDEFCYGIDAVILADFAKVKSKGKVIDLGTGTGIIPIILSHKTLAKEIWGIEIQKTSYERALRNLKLNNLEDRIKIINKDVKELSDLGKFDVVVTNPPYMKSYGGLKNKNISKSIARHESTASLNDFIKIASNILKDKGDFYMVHRPNRLVDICYACRQSNLEPKELRLVSPNKNMGPNIILIHCVKYGKAELKFLDPLYVYEENGNYTSEIINIYER